LFGKSNEDTIHPQYFSSLNLICSLVMESLLKVSGCVSLFTIYYKRELPKEDNSHHFDWKLHYDLWKSEIFHPFFSNAYKRHFPFE